MRAIAIILLLVTSATADDAINPKQPKKKPRRPTVQITISKETTRITKPLRADGYVDYIAALDQHASKGVTPKNNAAVLFFRAMGPTDKYMSKDVRTTYYKLLAIKPLAAEGDYFIDIEDYLETQKPAITEKEEEKFWDEFFRAAKHPWTKMDYPLLAGWLAANEKPLRLVVEGTRRPHCYWPLVGNKEDGELLAVLKPGIQVGRRFTKALCVRAMLHAGSGRIDAAWADLMASHRLARLTNGGPMLMDAISGTVLENMTCQADVAMAHHVDLSAKRAKRFAAELVKLPLLDGLADKFDVAARYLFLDSIRTVAQSLDEISAKSAKSRAALLRPRATNALVDWDHVSRKGNAWYDRIAAAARQPVREDRNKAFRIISDELGKALEKTNDSKAVLKRMVLGESPRKVVTETVGNRLAASLPGRSMFDKSVDKAAARMEMTRLAFALAAYRAENGSYPTRLADLRPKFLAKVPTDIFSAADFHYRTGKGGYRLWSIGPNGVDDGGQGQGVEDYEGDGDDLLVATPE